MTVWVSQLVCGTHNQLENEEIKREIMEWEDQESKIEWQNICFLSYLRIRSNGEQKREIFGIKSFRDERFRKDCGDITYACQRMNVCLNTCQAAGESKTDIRFSCNIAYGTILPSWSRKPRKTVLSLSRGRQRTKWNKSLWCNIAFQRTSMIY